MSTRNCCFIPEDQQAAAKAWMADSKNNGLVLSLGCEQPAKWQIWSGPAPDDCTESCTEHVGEMLTEAAQHRVYPIEE